MKRDGLRVKSAKSMPESPRRKVHAKAQRRRGGKEEEGHAEAQRRRGERGRESRKGAEGEKVVEEGESTYFFKRIREDGYARS
jgi:hypothetical protein